MALGGTGTGLGYAGINNGGAVALNLAYIYSSTGASIVAGMVFWPGSPPNPPSYLPTLPVDLTSGHPILVTLAYNGDGRRLTETLTDQTTLQRFSTTFTGINFEGLLGGQSGFVGFTGSTGDGNSVQTISNFQFTDPALANIPYANPITVAAAGELNLSSPISASAAVSSVTLNAGAVLSITRSGAVNPNAAYQITAGSVALAGNSATVNVTNNGSGLGSFAVASLSGNGTLVKTGAGALVLTAANPFSGPIVVDAGALVAADGAKDASGSATGSGPVTLNGGVLASDPGVGGTVGGSVVSGSGANAIAPGGIGAANTLTIDGSLTINSLSTLDFDLSGASASLLEVEGDLVFSGTGKTSLAFAGTGRQVPYTLATFPSGSSVSLGDFSAPAGYVLQLSATSLRLTAAPAVTTGTPTWTLTSSGSWTVGGNWSSGSPPSGVGQAAIVGAGTAVPLTIDLDGPQTVGQLTLANTSNASTGYTLAAGSGGTLTMNNSGGTAATAEILVTSGTHGISAPVVLAESLAVVASAGTTLDISGAIGQSAAGAALSLVGDGTLILGGSDSFTGGTTVSGGTLIALTSAALPDGTSLTVGAGGTLDFDPMASAAPLLSGAAASAGSMTAVPEPSALALLAAALFAAAAARWSQVRLAARRGRESTMASAIDPAMNRSAMLKDPAVAMMPAAVQDRWNGLLPKTGSQTHGSTTRFFTSDRAFNVEIALKGVEARYGTRLNDNAQGHCRRTTDVKLYITMCYDIITAPTRE